MNTVNNILETIDQLHRESRLEDAEVYMLQELEHAKNEGAWEIQLSILNELAGHYRDRGIMEKSLNACKQSEEIFEMHQIGETPEKAAAYLNTANAYRTMHNLKEAYAYYEKADAIITSCGDLSLKSSYYNNLALLYQEDQKFDDAIDCLKKALEIADKEMGDAVRGAISKTNLATTLIRVNRLDEANEYLLSAMEYFEGKTPSDFHYSATLSALGDMYLLKGDGKKAANYYEMALSEIELHMGQNQFYEIVKNHLDDAYEMMGGMTAISGLTLCEKYFNAFAKKSLQKNFPDILKHIACGMFGEGSECLGFDDALSKDHDFGPSFVIVCDETVSEEQRSELRKLYESLPKSYMGYKRMETTEGSGRVGVLSIKDILMKATGFDHIPKGVDEWQYTVDENLVLITNGSVFYDPAGWFTDIRTHINLDQPYYVYFNKLAMNLELMAKHGQYGYERACERGDAAAALIAKTEFIKATCKTSHLLMKEYAPYDKWVFKSLKMLTKKNRGMGHYFTEIVDSLEHLATRAVFDKADVKDMTSICNKISRLLISCGLCHLEDDYLLSKAYELKELANKTLIADKIVDIEWALFDKTHNDGGRANCQDDWGTFSIMRRSQYYVWPLDLLRMLYADFTEAAKNGRNIISEKYGYMMESTAPNEYEKIKDKLPTVSEDKKAIIHAITSIQVGFMEKFSEEYPGLASNARAIHTYEDNLFTTSYETYLRGELSTYHDDSLQLYGRFIAELASKGDNLAYRIMNMTTFFYGFGSLNDAK